MKGKEVIKIIKEYKLEDFDIEFLVTNLEKKKDYFESYKMEELININPHTKVVAFDSTKI